MFARYYRVCLFVYLCFRRSGHSCCFCTFGLTPFFPDFISCHSCKFTSALDHTSKNLSGGRAYQMLTTWDRTSILPAFLFLQTYLFFGLTLSELVAIFPSVCPACRRSSPIEMQASIYSVVLTDTSGAQESSEMNPFGRPFQRVSRQSLNSLSCSGSSNASAEVLSLPPLESPSFYFPQIFLLFLLVHLYYTPVCAICQ